MMDKTNNEKVGVKNNDDDLREDQAKEPWS